MQKCKLFLVILTMSFMVNSLQGMDAVSSLSPATTSSSPADAAAAATSPLSSPAPRVPYQWTQNQFRSFMNTQLNDETSLVNLIIREKNDKNIISEHISTRPVDQAEYEMFMQVHGIKSAQGKLDELCKRGPNANNLILDNEGRVKDLIRSGANPSDALLVAADNGHLRMCQWLVGNGAQVDPRDQWGFTPLMIAAARGHLLIVKFLIEQKANVDLQNRVGLTALVIAAHNRQNDVLYYLIEKKCDVNLSRRGESALVVVGAKGNMECLNALILAGSTGGTRQDIFLSNSSMRNIISTCLKYPLITQRCIAGRTWDPFIHVIGFCQRHPYAAKGFFFSSIVAMSALGYKAFRWFKK